MTENKKLKGFIFLDEKLNYLIAVAYLLKNVPKSILVDELPPVSALLLFDVYPIPNHNVACATFD